MATAKQISANRKNAKKSSGPRTELGKQIVSQNALKHGFFGRFQVLEDENQEQFNDLFNQLVLDQKPVGALETDLVRQMAEHLWVKERANRYLQATFILLNRLPDQKIEMGITVDMERFAQFENHNDRLFHRALKALLQLRKEREKSEIGFVRRKHAEAAESRREKRQEQGDQMFQVRYARAQNVNQLTELRLMKAIAAVVGPDTGQMAA